MVLGLQVELQMQNATRLKLQSHAAADAQQFRCQRETLWHMSNTDGSMGKS